MRKSNRDLMLRGAVRKTAVLLVLLLACVLTAFAADETANTVQLTKVEGTVVITKGDGTVVPIREKMRVYGDYIVTTGADGSAWLALDNSKLVTVDTCSMIQVQKSGKKLSLNVASGRLLFNVTEPLKPDESMYIRTSTMSCGVRGTAGWVEDDGEGAVIGLLHGEVVCESGETSTPVQAGKSVTVTTGADGNASISEAELDVEALPGFVQVEILNDPVLLEAVQNATQLDLSGLSAAGAMEKRTAEADMRMSTAAASTIAALADAASESGKMDLSEVAKDSGLGDFFGGDAAGDKSDPDTPVNSSSDSDSGGGDSYTPPASGTDRPGTDKPGTDKPGEEKPGEEKPGEEKPDPDAPDEEKPGEETPGEDKPGHGSGGSGWPWWSFTVTFFDANKQDTGNHVSVTFGNTVAKPENTDKVIIWYADDQNKNAFDFGTKIYANINLYAREADGACGENLGYTFDSTKGELKIFGTGEMDDDMNTNWTKGSTGTGPGNPNLVKTAKIENGVTSIGKNAFYSCQDMTSVSMADSVTSVGEKSFYNCDSLSTVKLSSEVTTIGNGAFQDSDKLLSVEMGDKVTTIGDEAFKSCDWLGSTSSVDLPNSVETIGDSAFSGCNLMTTVNIGSDPGKSELSSIGDGAFDDCAKLEAVNYNGTSEEWKDVSGTEDLDNSQQVTVTCTDDPPTGVPGFGSI